MTPGVVAVFGGSGFLGRAIVRRLTEAGMVARVVCRHPQTLELPRKGHPAEYPCADVRDEDSVAAALQGSDAVVNAVGLYVERGGECLDCVHVDGAERVARLAARAGVSRLVHISGIGADPASASAPMSTRGSCPLAPVRIASPSTALRFVNRYALCHAIGPSPALDA